MLLIEITLRRPPVPLMVDAYNVLHTTGILPPDLAGLGLMDLCRLMAVSRWGTEPALLVCDGMGADASEGPIDAGPIGAGLVSIHFAGHGADAADRFIEAAIQRDSAPRRLTVISSDHRVRNLAQRYRCRVLTSEDFLARLAEDHERFSRKTRRPIHAYEIPVDPLSVEWWLEYFGVMSDDEAGLHAIPGSPEPAPNDRPDEPPTEAKAPKPRPPTTKDRLDGAEEIDIDQIDPGDLLS